MWVWVGGWGAAWSANVCVSVTTQHHACQPVHTHTHPTHYTTTHTHTHTHTHTQSHTQSHILPPVSLTQPPSPPLSPPLLRCIAHTSFTHTPPLPPPCPFRRATPPPPQPHSPLDPSGALHHQGAVDLVSQLLSQDFKIQVYRDQTAWIQQLYYEHVVGHRTLFSNSHSWEASYSQEGGQDIQWDRDQDQAEVGNICCQGDGRRQQGAGAEVEGCKVKAGAVAASVAAAVDAAVEQVGGNLMQSQLTFWVRLSVAYQSCLRFWSQPHQLIGPNHIAPLPLQR